MKLTFQYAKHANWQYLLTGRLKQKHYAQSHTPDGGTYSTLVNPHVALWKTQTDLITPLEAN